jgi:hypothetical protein
MFYVEKNQNKKMCRAPGGTLTQMDAWSISTNLNRRK